jgi:hypothetical protein
MQKRLIFLLVVSFICASGIYYAQHYKDLTQDRVSETVRHNLLDNQGKPSALLLRLLHELEINHDGTLASIVSATQKAWLRPAGKERWEMEMSFEDKRSQLIPLFEQLGFVCEVVPRYDHYDYVLVLGALAERVRTRLAYLKHLWENGVKFDSIVFLGGSRPLQPDLESSEILLNRYHAELPASSTWQFDGVLPTTELEMMRFIFEQADLPDQWKTLPLVWVDAPMIQTPEGKLRRPNTEDTIKTWLKQQPKPGRCLVISNQPYVYYQDAVVRTHLSGDFTIDSVGKSAEAGYAVSLYLDTIARTLYQEQKRLNS